MMSNEYQEFWTSIIHKVEKIKALDPKCELYSSAKFYHHYQRLPVVPEKEIIAFEKEYKLELPENYRTYLQYFGEGGAGPPGGVASFHNIVSYYKDKIRRGEVFTPAYPSEIDAISGCDGDVDDSTHPISELHGLLYIGYHGQGENFLVVNGKEHGLVWFWDYDCLLCNRGQFDQWYENWADGTLTLIDFLTITEDMDFDEIKSIVKVDYEIVKLSENPHFDFDEIVFKNVPSLANIRISPDYDPEKEDFKIIKINKPSCI